MRADPTASQREAYERRFERDAFKQRPCAMRSLGRKTDEVG